MASSSIVTEAYDLGGRGLHAQATRYKDSVMVHIREMSRNDNGHLRFTKKGLALTESEWTCLKDSVTFVEEALVAYQGGKTGTTYRTIGDRGRRITIKEFQNRAYVDIRNYYDKDNNNVLVPTHRGAVLSPDAWRELCDAMILLDDDIAKLREDMDSRAARKRSQDDRRRQLLKAREAAATADASGPSVKHPTIEESQEIPLLMDL